MNFNNINDLFPPNGESVSDFDTEIAKETWTEELRGIFRKKIVRVNGETRRETVAFKKVPRNIWTIQAVFFGSRTAMPTRTPLGGELFSPDSAYGFEGEPLHPALYITLAVKNNSPVAAPFRAVFLGTASFDPVLKSA